MFFIRCGGAIAWVLVVLGILRIAFGIFGAVSEGGFEIPEVATRLLAPVVSASSINDGLILFAAGIFMGLLVQIAKGVKFD